MPEESQDPILEAQLEVIELIKSISRTLYSPFDRPIYNPVPDHMEPAEAERFESIIRITLSDPGDDIFPEQERFAELAIKTFSAAGVKFEDKGRKTVPGDDGDVHVHSIEVDLEDTELAAKVEKAKRTVIPALAGIAALEKAAGEEGISDEERKAFVSAAAELADVKAVVQGVQPGGKER